MTLKLKLLQGITLLILLCVSLNTWGQTTVTFDVINGSVGQYSQYYGQNVNVSLENKSFNANEWQGACFPFSATEAQLNAALGEGNWNIQKYDSYADGVLTFKKVNSVEGGVPYIMMVKSAVENPTFNGVTFVDDIPSNFWVKNTINSNLEWRGFYLRKYQYEIYDSNSDQTYTGYIVNSDGTLANVRTAPWAEQGYPGCGASFYGANNQNITLSLEGVTAGNGEQDPESIDPNSLAGKIALRHQITNLPTIYLDIPDVTDVKKLSEVLFKNRTTDEALYHNTAVQVVDANGRLAEFTEASEFAQIKVRGNSTADPEKKPYRIKFAKKHKHDLLGYGYDKRNWVLLANCFDHSLIRNALTYELGKEIGMPFNPGYQFVDLVINGDYRGTYQVSDQVEADANRVNIDEDRGWMIEFQGRGDMLDKPAIQEGGCPMFSIKNPDEDDYTTAQFDSIKNEMKTWIHQWVTGWSYDINKFQSDTEGWRAYNDEDQLMKFMLETEITADYDGYMSVKAYRDGGKLFFGPVWDKDLAYDNITAGDEMNNLAASIGTSTLRLYFYNGDGKNNLWNDPRFMKKFHDAFYKLYNNDNLISKMNAKIDELTVYLDESQKLNFEKWGITDAHQGLQKYHEYTVYSDYTKQLKEFFPKRLAFLKEKIDAQYTALGCASLEDNPVVARTQKNASVPTIYIDTPSVGDDWTVATKFQVLDSQNSLGLGSNFENTVFSVQYQGSHSTTKKNSYRLKFDSKTKLLPSGKYKQWVLLANDDDPSLVRNALTKELGDQLGMAFTPGAQFVDLYLNDSYLGTYQITDRVKAESGRALVSGGNKDEDWLVELDDKSEVDEGDLYVEGTDVTPYLNIKNPDPDDMPDEATKEAKKAEFSSWFNTTWADMENHVDQASFINWYIASEILGDYKQFSAVNTYRSATAEGAKLFFGPLWDNEKSYQNRPKHPTDMSDLNTDGSYNGLLAISADNGVWKAKLQGLWKEEWFKNGVTERWNAVHDNLKTALLSKLTALQTAIDETQADNFAAVADGGAGWSRTIDEATAIQSIHDYLTQRFAYLDKKFAAMATGDAVDYIFNPAASLADSQLESYVGKNVNITILNRTLKNDRWNTFCVPFNASHAEMVTALGCDYELYVHTGVSGDVMYFDAAGTKDVKHGIPYLIKPVRTTAGTNLVFNNVTIAFKATSTDNIVSFDNNQHQFVGNINHVDLAPDGTNFFLSSNQLYKATTNNYRQDGTRCYFATSSPKAKINILGIDNETSIDEINSSFKVEPASSAVYNLQGQKVAESADQQLPRGVYIVNGKKIIK